MPTPGRTLVEQLVWPVVGLVLVAVLANVAFAAWLATHSAVVAARAGRERIVAALDRSRITLSPAVVEALGDLTGSELVVWDDAHDTAAASTLPPDELRGALVRLRSLRDGEVVTVGSGRYVAGLVRSSGVRPERAVVLTPVQRLAATTWKAAWPALAVAAGTLAVLVPLGVQVLRDRLVAGERDRLLGQLAAGFAHELRNAITGAKLAIDLHRRRCRGTADAKRPDDSLAVASRQLDIVEEEVRGLLALGRPPVSAPEPVDLDALAAEVRDLVGPRCGHAGVALASGSRSGTSVAGRRDGLRAALVNLALNAIDAAGTGGHVTVAVETADGIVSLVVEDDGPGPPATLAGSLHEPFVTGKPEGVGLGLAVARTVAEQHGGTLEWRRVDGRTRFEIRIPAPRPAARAEEPAA